MRRTTTATSIPPTELHTHRDRGEHIVKVRVRGGYQTYVLDYHPFDVVGWDGYVYPWTFSIHDFEPITGRIHMPPPSHQTFAGPNFVICSFCPRKLDFDPEAVPIPYHHSNLQSEEMIYYVDGNFSSRRGIEVGSVTLHPSGLPHGPQPGLAEKSLGLTETHELAVMCDTFHPLKLTGSLPTSTTASTGIRGRMTWHRRARAPPTRIRPASPRTSENRRIRFAGSAVSRPCVAARDPRGGGDCCGRARGGRNRRGECERPWRARDHGLCGLSVPTDVILGRYARPRPTQGSGSSSTGDPAGTASNTLQVEPPVVASDPDPQYLPNTLIIRFGQSVSSTKATSCSRAST